MEYLTELTQGPAKEYFRPNFFTNTPDILPIFLQDGGRPAFRIRLVLAATLSGVYGDLQRVRALRKRRFPVGSSGRFGRFEFVELYGKLR